MAVKEKIALGEVTDNAKNKALCNAYEKLADEEIEEIRKLVSGKRCSYEIKKYTETVHVGNAKVFYRR